jgi:hypothetical protein
MVSSLGKILLGWLAAVVALGLVRYQPWKGSGESQASRRREHLSVGFLPVT